MPRYKRVSSPIEVRDPSPLEETQWGDPSIDWSVPQPAEMQYSLPPDLTPLLIIARLADRVATRYLAGKMGMALENDARAIRGALDSLPDELKGLL